MTVLTDWFERNKKWLAFCLVCVFIWGMAAHGYAFFRGLYSHDSLNEIHSGIVGNDIKVGSGRFLTPIYRDLVRSDLTMPWLIGILSLFWLGLTLFLVVKLFRVESKVLAFVIAGVLSTNIAVSSTAATYIHDLDCYQFAVLCAALAALLWRRYPKGWLLGILPLAGTLGIYQSYLFVAVTLVVMVSILDLVDGRPFRLVFANGLRAVAMVVLAAVVYFAAMKGYLWLTGAALSANDYNSLDLVGKLSLSGLPGLLWGAYLQTLSRIWYAYSSYPGILVKAATAGLLLLSLWAVTLGLKKMGIRERVLCIALVVLLPLLMNFIYVITSGYCHDMMSWPTWFAYVLALLLCSRLSWQKPVCMLLVAGLLWGNVQFANGMYLKKNLEQDAYLSLMTRVVDRMEQTGGYVNGQTPVVIAGLPEEGRVLNAYAPGMTEFWNVTGLQHADTIYQPGISRYQAYFSYILGTPTVMAEEELWYTVLNSDFTAQMPAFPAAGCVAMHDGVLIVKLGNA